MVYYVGAGAWMKTYQGRNSCGGPESETRLGRKRKKKTGRSYHHHCVAIEIDTNGNVVGRDNEVAYNAALGGHHPCKGLGKSKFLGGGTNSSGNQHDFSGRTANYDSSHFAFRCEVPDSKMTSANLKSWSGSSHMNNGANGASAVQSGTRKSLWDQLVMGVDVPGVSSSAFCKKVENLPVVVHNNGSTCYNLIDNNLKQANRKLYCAQNETDERCACRNISHYGTKRCIEEKSTLPGCSEVKAGFDKYPANAVTEFDVKSFTPTCFAQGICSRDGQYLPDSQPGVCAQTIAICKQDVEFYGDIIGGSVTVDQEMDCSASSTQAPSSGTGDVPAGGGGGGDGEDEEEETGFNAYIPKSLDGLKTNRKQQMGAGGVGAIFMACCMMILLLVVSAGGNGGGGPVARRFR
jgi:hypothetical protein